MAATQRQVWMIISSFYPIVAGEERQTQWESKALRKRGFPVQVITRRHSSHAEMKGQPPTDTVDGIPLTRVYSRGMSKFQSIAYLMSGLWHLIRRGRRGIYHARDIGATGWMAVLAKYLLGGKTVIKLPAGRYTYEQRLRSRLSKWQFPKLLGLTDRVIVVSKEVEDMLRQLGVSQEKIVRVPNSVDTNFFRPPSSEERQAARGSLGIPDSALVVLFVGRLTPVKGPDILLKGWSRISAEIRKDAQLILVGDGEQRQELEIVASNLGIAENLRMEGLQADVRQWYWIADLFVLPSKSEGLSTALIEAMACGLPALASRVGGAPDVVVEGENGCLFQREDEVELSEKLASMLNTKESLPNMGFRARQTATSYADIEITVDRVQRIYSELA